MEYRIWITVPDLPLADERKWEPFVERFEQRHPQLGPVLGWEGGEAVVVVSTLAADEADAARIAADATADVLHACDLGDRYPAALAVEPAGEERTQVPA